MHSACLWIACLGSISGPATPPMPISWSSDGRWLAYTEESGAIASPRPGWLFGEDDPDPPADPAARKYRLWATCPETRESVLLLESATKISAPSWRRDGASLAYGKVVAGSEGGPAWWEVVIQDAPDHARVVLRDPIPGRDLPDSVVKNLAPAFSPDGRLLVVPRVSPSGLRIVRAEGGRVVRTIEGASRPQWSREGGKLAFFRDGPDGGLFMIEAVQGQARRLSTFESGDSEDLPPPLWSRDNLYLQYLRLAQVDGDDRGKSRCAIQIVRVNAGTGAVESTSELSLEPIPDRKQWLGASLTSDPLGQHLFYATASVGQEASELRWCENAEKPLEIKLKWNPYNETALVGALAARPSARGLAFRLGNFGAWSPPALFDPNRGEFSLMAPDEASRREWQGRITLDIRDILRAIPAPSLDEGKIPIERPSLLPAPGELEENEDVVNRLRRMAKLAMGLGPIAEPETRAALAYLAGDYPLAMAAIDRMREEIAGPERSARLLALRAQILLAQKDFAGAKLVVSYLESRARPQYLVEETMDGTKLHAVADPRARWPEYLALKIEILKNLKPMPNPDAEEPDVAEPLRPMRPAPGLFTPRVP